MAIIKCKMCGGDIELTEDKTFGTCEFCGSTMTFPKVDDDQRAAAFNRGNHFRRIGEFDKALAVYERIVREDDTDAEAHWCCALCRFGIEYVEDPTTYEYLPTCHRASFDSFLEDVDYLAAVEHSEGITRRQYQKDAAKIAEVQRGILATSQNEEPFDVFICYKETDENGERTKDSLMAQDVYYQLTDQGYRVFFARITLEDVGGKQYEPYIFAALNSARVMIVIGTKAEHMNAVWVKNEWSRFLAMMKKDRHKLLLPCYRDMDPYDMPEQLSVLQSYDMSKIGFIQDLIRGIKKVLDAEKKPEIVSETVVVQQTATNTAPLLERAFMFLEDGDWASADEYCEKVLDLDPKNARAYLGKLMAKLRVKKQEQLKDQAEPFDREDLFQKTLRFGDDALKATLSGYITHINDRNKEKDYQGALALMKGNSIQGCQKAIEEFQKLSGYKDAAARIKECNEKTEALRKEGIYKSGCDLMKLNTAAALEKAKGEFSRIPGYKDATALIKECTEKAEALRKEEEERRKEGIYKGGCDLMKQNTAAALEKAKGEFSRIPGYKDADARKKECDNKIAEINANAEKERKKYIKIAAIIGAGICAVIAFLIILNSVIIPNGKYNDAVTLMETGKYEAAMEAFMALGGYKDSYNKVDQCKTGILNRQYDEAAALLEAGKYEAAMEAFRALGGHKDSYNKVDQCKTGILDRQYDEAVALLETGNDRNALIAFDALDGHKDSPKQAEALRVKLTQRETVSAGYDHTVGLKADGTVVAVGSNSDGQCNVSGWTNIIAVSAGGLHTVGLKPDGTVIAVGGNTYGQCNVSDWKDIIAVSAGYYHTVGLKADGAVVAVGYNNNGQCDVSGWKDIIAVSTGSYHTVGLKADGTVIAVGRNDDGQCNVSIWRDIVAVSAGSYHTVGLKADGTVVAVGYNGGGQCNVVFGWTNIIAVSAGGSHIVGLKPDGTVIAVGGNTYGQCNVSDWKDIIAVSADSCHTVGLKADGTVVAVGSNGDGQCDVSDWKDIKLPD